MRWCRIKRDPDAGGSTGNDSNKLSGGEFRLDGVLLPRNLESKSSSAMKHLTKRLKAIYEDEGLDYGDVDDDEETIVDRFSMPDALTISTLLEDLVKQGHKVQKELRCNICFSIPQQPCLTTCNHLICKPCFDGWMKEGKGPKHCPVCKFVIDTRRNAEVDYLKSWTNKYLQFAKTFMKEVATYEHTFEDPFMESQQVSRETQTLETSNTTIDLNGLLADAPITLRSIFTNVTGLEEALKKNIDELKSWVKENSNDDEEMVEAADLQHIENVSKPVVFFCGLSDFDEEDLCSEFCFAFHKEVEITRSLTNAQCLVVMGKREYAEHSLAYRTATTKGMRIIDGRWVRDSLRCQKLCDMMDYAFKNE
ncbi:unnamed protein product, partial [Mesorhabditis belari]|uniref:RING-type E3 ubiquitin transferase n=1 Tax=Mesorhabditis belari TaxID=2138241 RepID=A0AAF3J8R1_9BILA